MPKKKKNKIKGEKFEKNVQKSINSGSLWFSPLDLDYKDYCVEVKYTDLKGFRITKKLLEKIWGQALDMQKLPLLVIGIKRNEEQIFSLTCRVNLEQKKV